MKITNTRSVIIFTISPFFSGVALNWIMHFTIKATNPFPYPPFFGAGLGWAAFIIYFIPATLVGLVYVFTGRLNHIFQELICCLSGFIISFLWFSPLALGGYKPELGNFFFIMGVTGALTSFFVARLLNYLKYKKLKRIKADRKRRKYN